MKRFLTFVVPLLIVVGALLACGASDTTNTGSTTPSNSTTTPASHFKVGSEVTVGSTWKAVVNSIATNPGTDYEHPTKGVYVVVNMSLTNISNKEQNLSSLLELKFKSTDGTEYNETFLSGTSPSPNGKVEAGGVSKGDLVYDVPVDQKNFTLSFSPDLASSGQTIWDLSL